MREAGYIYSWSELENGDIIIEDTYNEVYAFYRWKGQNYIRQVGYQSNIWFREKGKPERGIPSPPNIREIVWDPNPNYDQPWIFIASAYCCDKGKDLLNKDPNEFFKQFPDYGKLFG